VSIYFIRLRPCSHYERLRYVTLFWCVARYNSVTAAGRIAFCERFLIADDHVKIRTTTVINATDSDHDETAVDGRQVDSNNSSSFITGEPDSNGECDETVVGVEHGNNNNATVVRHA